MQRNEHTISDAPFLAHPNRLKYAWLKMNTEERIECLQWMLSEDGGECFSEFSDALFKYSVHTLGDYDLQRLGTSRAAALELSGRLGR